MKSLEDVLADWKGNAAVLRSHGDEARAALLERLADEVTEAALEYVTWQSEGNAMLRSGRKAGWFRVRFSEWQQAGHARRGSRGEREYRMLIVPMRANIESARAAGKRAARKAAA